MMATSSTTSQCDTIMAKPTAKSIVWDYFGVEKGSNGRPTNLDVAICRSCHKSVKAKNGNTSNLLGHLRTHHAVIHSEVTKAMKAKQTQKSTVSRTDVSIGQSTLQESLEKSQKYERKSKKWKDITDAVTYCIAKDSLPIYTVEKPGFQRLVKTLDNDSQYLVILQCGGLNILKFNISKH